MIITPSKLIEFGQALAGDDWVGTLARRLQKSKRTIERWRDEEAAMPPGLYAVLEGLVEQQIAALERLREI